MTVLESHARLMLLLQHEDPDVQVILGAKAQDGEGWEHQKVDMGVHVAGHFHSAAREAVASRDVALDPIHFQPGDQIHDSRLVYLEPQEIPGVDAVVDAIEPAQNHAWFTGANEFGRRLRYYVVRVQVGNQIAHCFRRANQKQELAKRGLLVRLSGHRFTEVEDKLFMFDERIDFVIFEGYTFFITYDPFMKLFAEDVKQAFAARAAPAFALLQTRIEMENFADFEEACCADARLSGALIRVNERGGLANLTTDYVLTKNDILTGHKLTVETRPDGSRAIRFEPAPTKRFILLKILEEKVNRGDLTGMTWIAGSHVRG